VSGRAGQYDVVVLGSGAAGLVEAYADTSPEVAAWLEDNTPVHNAAGRHPARIGDRLAGPA
jgi:hypothetical protein